jgi:hypothetical protein
MGAPELLGIDAFSRTPETCGTLTPGALFQFWGRLFGHFVNRHDANFAACMRGQQCVLEAACCHIRAGAACSLCCSDAGKEHSIPTNMADSRNFHLHLHVLPTAAPSTTVLRKLVWREQRSRDDASTRAQAQVRCEGCCGAAGAYRRTCYQHTPRRREQRVRGYIVAWGG